ncbi:LysR family transcriptional regulator [Streptosporangium lutulentum]|uniref:DNA-binding transcriptional LysR family regulator n=1 Tax=Streptosporangium lutulentum TaxID=1461250 RepID=A0ABT9QML5_9ACTN|nr:LysR substrate-binding domain-containing protein [Streptosporangium lutulentum]MDP9847164.1 DNA-binding transcriptional LysR family regulator [Streptosporangium lutulentum]
MDENLRLVRYFLAVAEELHFRRAAARLFVSQPTLSDQIRRLEQHLGVQLFERTGRGVVLTPAGKEFEGEARTVLTAWEQAVAITRSAAAERMRTFVIGFVANAAAELTPLITRRFRGRHSGIGLEMRQYDFREPLAGLGAGQVDVVLTRPPLGHIPWLHTRTLFAEPRVLIVPTAHLLAGRDTVSVEDVLDEPFIAWKAPGPCRDFWLALDQRKGHPIRIGREVVTVDECLESILMGAGVAFAQASSRRFYARPGLAFVPTTGLPLTSVVVAWCSDHETPLVRDFVHVAREIAEIDGCRVPVPGAVPRSAAL